MPSAKEAILQIAACCFSFLPGLHAVDATVPICMI